MMLVSVTTRMIPLSVGSNVVVFLRSDCSRSVCSIYFIAAVRSVQRSEAASASVFDTSLRAFLNNTCCFSDKFVSEFVLLLLF